MRRHDVSNVPLQGAYVAQRCPVRAQNDLLIPAEPVPPTPFAEHLIDSGRRHEDAVFAELVRQHPEAAVAPRLFGDDLEAWTVALMEVGAPLILGSGLPTDREGRRVGRPDLLVRAESGGYRAVEVKGHLALEPLSAKSKKAPAPVSSLATPEFEAAVPAVGWTGRRHRADLLQLAHYQRMLEASGKAATDGRWVGVIGTEGQVVWRDLDDPMWQTPSSVPGQKKRRTTMEVYDHEFDFRLDLLAVAMDHERDRSVQLLVVPVKTSECDTCPWWERCKVELHKGYGDVSLLTPGMGWPQWKEHRQRGIRDRSELASLDSRTARLVTKAKVDVPTYLELIRGLGDAMPIIDVPEITEADRSALEAEEVTTVAHLRRLCPVTATFYDAADSSGLAQQIDLARAALGPAPAYRARDVERLVVPRADVEVDVDMENNFEGRVYMWGTLLAERRGGAAPTYVPFEDLSHPLTEEGELTLFRSFWNWFCETRARAIARGNTFASYCYSAAAENHHLLRLAEAAGALDQVKEFVEGPEWIDLYEVVRRQLVTGTGLGLKEMAPAAGFVWVVDDAGGRESMVRYQVATDRELPDTDRAEARDWLLRYNRGDVEATLTLRDWMEREALTIEPVENLDPREPSNDKS